MGDAHEARQVDDALAVLKDAGRHAIALALEYPAARPAGRDAAGILAAVLEVVETLVQVGGCLGARRVGKEKTKNAAHVAGSVCSTDDEVIGLDEVEGWPARSDGRVAGWSRVPGTECTTRDSRIGRTKSNRFESVKRKTRLNSQTVCGLGLGEECRSRSRPWT